MVLCSEGGGIEKGLGKFGFENLWECLSNECRLRFYLSSLSPIFPEVLILYSFFFFLLHLWHTEVPGFLGPGIELTPQE